MENFQGLVFHVLPERNNSASPNLCLKTRAICHPDGNASDSLNYKQACTHSYMSELQSSPRHLAPRCLTLELCATCSTLCQPFHHGAVTALLSPMLSTWSARGTQVASHTRNRRAPCVHKPLRQGNRLPDSYILDWKVQPLRGATNARILHAETQEALF